MHVTSLFACLLAWKAEACAPQLCIQSPRQLQAVEEARGRVWWYEQSWASVRFGTLRSSESCSDDVLCSGCQTGWTWTDQRWRARNRGLGHGRPSSRRSPSKRQPQPACSSPPSPTLMLLALSTPLQPCPLPCFIKHIAMTAHGEWHCGPRTGNLIYRPRLVVDNGSLTPSHFLTK